MYLEKTESDEQVFPNQEDAYLMQDNEANIAKETYCLKLKS